MLMNTCKGALRADTVGREKGRGDRVDETGGFERVNERERRNYGSYQER